MAEEQHCHELVVEGGLIDDGWGEGRARRSSGWRGDVPCKSHGLGVGKEATSHCTRGRVRVEGGQGMASMQVGDGGG